MYTIRHAAKRVGVPEATLRAWQRRYLVVTPGRTASGYRLYDDDDIARLRRMRSLIDAGWAPRQAAEQVRSAVVDASGRPASGRDVPDLLSAAARLDPDAVTRMLDERLATVSFEDAVDEWLMPELVRLGDAWASGRISVAGEHVVATAVQRRLSALFDVVGAGSSAAPVLTGLPSGCRHELGMLCFAVAAKRRGLAVVHLGADLPTADWVSAAEEHRPVCAVVTAPAPADVAAAHEVVAALSRPAMLVAVGGRCQEDVRRTCSPELGAATLWLGHRIGDAAATLAARLIAGTR